MNDEIDRTRLLIGDGADRLAASCVAVFGLGGVGGFVVEALCRAGVGKLILVDFDRVNASNKNRQIFALNSTVGMLKTDVAKERIADICPQTQVVCFPLRFSEQTKDEICLDGVDFCVDCIDDVVAKVLLAKVCKEKSINLICCLGTANRLTADFVFCDIFSTSHCPLAAKFRSLLRKSGIDSLQVLTSLRSPDVVRSAPLASISYVPATAGLMLAQKVICHLINTK